MSSAIDTPVSPAEIRTCRLLAAVGGAVYLIWWFIVEAIVPDSHNPFVGRLVVVLAWWALALASFVDARVARRMPMVVAIGAWLITTHLFMLLWTNPDALTWWAGYLITVAACAAMLRSARANLAYSIFALALGVADVVGRGVHERAIFLAMLVTLLVLMQIVLRARLDVERERADAIVARAARDRAEDANRTKSLFLALVSHELRTPLQTIRLTTDAIAEDREARPARLARIASSVQRLTDVIESMLEYTRAEAGALRPVASDFDLADLVSETVNELSPLATAKQLAMTVHAADRAAVVHSDPKLVRALVTNLVTNAIRHTHQGTIDVEVSPSRVSVRDSGPGIAFGDRDRIFEPFTQLESVEHKHTCGVGLGLALVKELAAVLGARVEMSSEPGVGSCFTVVMPGPPS